MGGRRRARTVSMSSPSRLVAVAVEQVVELPRAAGEVGPREADHRGGRVVGVVDDDEAALVLGRPAPGQQLIEGVVVGPAGRFALLPLAVSELVGDLDESEVEAAEIGVVGFRGSSSEEDGDVDLPSVELAFVPQGGAGQGGDGDGGGPECCWWELAGGSWFVVVLGEPQEMLLVVEVGGQGGRARRTAARGGDGRRAACRSSSRSRAVAVATRGPSRPRRRTACRGGRLGRRR